MKYKREAVLTLFVVAAFIAVYFGLLCLVFGVLQVSVKTAFIVMTLAVVTINAWNVFKKYVRPSIKNILTRRNK